MGSIMKVAIRCDASNEIGTGHVMRCLTLAEQLRSNGGEVSFISRDHVGNMNDYIESHGYQLHRLPLDRTSRDGYENEYARWLTVSLEKDVQDTVAWLREQESSVDWMIVDHYGLDDRWERAVRPFCERIMVIDDLANRRHDCDLLLDQNYFEGYEQRYEGLVPDHCGLLLGPKYVLLRDEFAQMRSKIGKRRSPVERVLIFFGGVDTTDQTSLALRAVQLLDRTDIHYDVVVGSTNRNRNKIIDRCRSILHVTCHVQVENMAELMACADLALAAGGTTTYERMYMKLPSITVSVANNQTKVLEALSRQGYLRYLGRAGSVAAKHMAQAVKDFERDELEVREFEFDKRNNILWSQLQDCAVAR
jgi:UDP-2,4-diacetamido-2,4,6-trideoxy-beta-L-altropyranose hydrolase